MLGKQAKTVLWIFFMIPSFSQAEFHNDSADSNLGYAYGTTTDQARQTLEEDAAKRHAEMLEYTKKTQDIIDAQNQLDGMPAIPTSPDNVRAMTSEQRLQSYLNASNPDPELVYDLENRSTDYLEAKYGTVIADYAREEALQAVRNLSLATSYLPEEARTGNFLTGFIGGIWKGFLNIADIIGSSFIMMTNSGEGETEKLTKWHEMIKQKNTETTVWQGSTYEMDEARSKLNWEIAERAGQETFLKHAARTGNVAEAKQLAAAEAEHFYNSMDTTTYEEVVNALGKIFSYILTILCLGAPVRWLYSKYIVNR